jgi:hypothetical protein
MYQNIQNNIIYYTINNITKINFNCIRVKNKKTLKINYIIINGES